MLKVQYVRTVAFILHHIEPEEAVSLLAQLAAQIAGLPT